MKRYLSNFKFTQDFVKDSILDCLSHSNKIVRWNRKDTSYFLADYYIKGDFTDNNNVDEVANFIRKDIQDHFNFYRDELIPYVAKEIYNEMMNRTLELPPIVYQKRKDRSSGKLRDIGITSIKQQVCDYVCVNALKPLFNAKICFYQCSSIKGRGQMHAKNAIEKCIRKKHKNARYAIKCDIKKCYQSINHDILLKLLKRDVKNDDVLYLVEFLLSTYSKEGRGLCIGTYSSQYLANYYLSYAYHYITEVAYIKRKDRKNGKIKEIRPFKRVVFYMDDMVFLGSNKKYMKRAIKMLIEYLKNELNLELKHGTYQVIDLFKDGAFIDVVGYRFYKDHTTIRRRTYHRISDDTRKINRLKDKSDIKLCRSFMSRNGFVKHSDSVKFKRRNKYNNAFNIARRVIRDEAKSNLHRKAA